MPDPSLALELTNVDKRYSRKVHALKSISLSVRKGEIFGLLGPNGAGKSTLVKIIMTVIRPTKAEGFVMGQPVASKASLVRVGYLPEHHRFPRYLTGRQTLDFFSALSGTHRRYRKQHIPELLDIVGMSDWADAKVSNYSKGMMQRIGIAQALSADPELVVLDEPTDGVDPVGRRDIRDVLLRLKNEGKTVFINSHLLSELELISDRFAIMVGGQVARQGTLNDLTAGRRGYEIETEPKTHLSIAACLSVAFAAPNDNHGTLPDGRAVELMGSTIKIDETDSVRIQPLLDALRASGHVIRRVQIVQPTLEQLFMESVTALSPNNRPYAGARIS